MQAPYLVIPILLLTLAGYLVSAILVNAGILGRTTHRKIWNSLLLVSFLVAGLLGILLAVRVNYKLDWPWLEAMMKWHVDAGILMSTVAAIHLGWHLTYYRKLFRKAKPTLSEVPNLNAEAAQTHAARGVTWLALTLGFFTMVVQVLLIREITTVFQGNEVMLAWTLAAWMFLTGMGSWFGRSFGTSRDRAGYTPNSAGPSGKALSENPDGPSAVTLNRVFLLMAFLPPLTVLGMNWSRNFFFLPGTLVNPLWFIIALLLLLAPLCLLSGYAFAMLVKAAEQGNKRFAAIYAIETAGSLAGGIAVSFLLVRWLSVMESLLFTSLLVMVLLWSILKEKRALPAALLFLILMVLFVTFPLDQKIKSFLFGNQEVVATHETPYGNITVCVNGDEKTIFENGSALFNTGDAIVSEEFVHYAMLQHPSPEKVLVVSGDLPAIAAEVLKYPGITRLDYVEINPGLMELISPYKEIPNDDRITIIPGDARRFIQRTSDRWDVVIMAVPDPSSMQINRYYTEGFISLLKQKLNRSGVVIYGISPSGNYISPEKINLEASLFQTLSGSFSQVRILPGERDYFIASDDSLSARIGELSASRGIGGNYVNIDYMDDLTLESRGKAIVENIRGINLTNSDLKPLPVFYHTLRYLSQFMGRNFALLLIPVVLLLVFLHRMNPVSAGMFVTGLTASSTEILLIFWFQVVFGNLYAAIGVIFALFMGGLALGSAAGNRYPTGRRHFHGRTVDAGRVHAAVTLVMEIRTFQLSTGPSLAGFYPCPADSFLPHRISVCHHHADLPFRRAACGNLGIRCRPVGFRPGSPGDHHPSGSFGRGIRKLLYHGSAESPGRWDKPSAKTIGIIPDLRNSFYRIFRVL